MTQETEQDAPAETEPQEQDRSLPARAVRRRRAPKQDPLLVADVATARTAVEEIAQPGHIGEGHRVEVEEDRLVIHLFECTLPGYRGWNWFASLARAPRSKTVTVCEVGLLPGEDALLAPEWVPWSDRVSAEEKAQEEQDREDADEQDTDQPGADEQEADQRDADQPGAEPLAAQDATAQDATAQEESRQEEPEQEEPAGGPEGERS
ncbi:hypothetical protein GCM10011374_00530 [Kocuria dechangensis]|uniref:DUF3027 domain-containing protein n=1 Tax=Kocuria dechangensis TaxID=1176249 RepID=A0A917GEL1_9MICC|nr:DUF3027 domain-containing protein [Kocuria dechangensis]GGG42077.1 hypothetical protein GCM10011374_00530 [Kocuria dechangensis]